MKKYSAIIQLTCCIFLTMVGYTIVNGQTYKPGDLYTFQDGSKGIVFYVNPDNPTTGTVAALRDLDGRYALWTGNRPQSLNSSFFPNGYLSISGITSWESHGKHNTQLLAASGTSPVVNAIMDSFTIVGWYIPDAMQLYNLYASAAYLSDAFEFYGGDIQSLWMATHWSSTCLSTPNGNAYMISYNFKLENASGTTVQNVRLVRDFPDDAEIQAYWADSPHLSDTVVSPDFTTDYEAFVVSGFDTLSMAATVTVNLPSTDTLHETVYASSQPYTSVLAPIFNTLDISHPGLYEFKDTLHTIQGCDSIVTLLLTVGENVRYSDTLCPLKEDYYFAPLDTVFAVGTVSGVYEHHGTKLVDGLPVDTIAYYELTILPVYERFDTIRWCLYEPSETRQYEGNEHVSVTVNGASVTVTSNSEDVVVEEIVANTDFALWMQTVNGCDSVFFLHVDARRVMRDTVYADVLVTQVAGGQHTVACHTFTGIDAPGTYRATDTLMASNGCDSLVTVVLIVEPLHEETICDSTLTADLIWQSNLSDYVWNGEPMPTTVGTSGYYEFPGQRIVEGVAVDTVSYLQLIVHQSYQERDTVSFCMEEATYTAPYDDVAGVTIAVAADGTVSVTTEATSGVEVTSVPGSKTDFALRMQTVAGCDSVVFLHVDARRVERDTVRYIVNQHQVENEHVTVGDYTFESITAAGTYELRDTLTASNGCDSIVTLLLTVGENVRYSDTLCPLKEDYYFAPLDTVFAVGTVSGVYEHHGTKIMDGLPVDTIAYYDLTILPVYEQFDTIEWCLYEPLETRQYEGNAHVSVTVNGTSVNGTVVTVTSSSEDVVVEEIVANTDFALRMQTTSGCDSVVFLHVDVSRVMRDTVYADVLITQVAGGQHTAACHTFTGIDAPGTYRATDTLTASNGCDSLVTVVLVVEALHEETLCDSTLTADLIWQSNLADYTWNGEPLPATVGTSGYYEFSGQRIVDGVVVDTVSYLQLIVHQSYQVKDTVSFCMEEATYTAPYDDVAGVTIAVAADGTVSVTAEAASGVEVIPMPGSTTDFLLRMQTISGCDSVVFLYVDARRVERDTVRYIVNQHQVENEHVTVGDYTFESITAAGTYELRDTLTASNGCDSIVTLLLTVGENVRYSDTLCPLKEDYYFAPLDTVFAVGTVSGVYEHHGTKLVDGLPVDTIAYYDLTILPVYEQFDTIEWCLYEPSETRQYEGNAHVSVTVNGASVTVTSNSEDIVVEEIVANTDFVLRMQTISGCDSVVFLHVDARRVERDTVRYIVNQHQVENEHVTVGDYTFESITAAGTYELRDTLTASNGCDSIVTLLLTVGENVRYSDTLCPLKEDYYFAPLDTVFAVGTVSGVYEHHGTKLVDGLPVDTIAYYDLTILPVYEQFDTIRWCLYEPSETRQYEGNEHVSVTVNGASVNGTVVTVTSNSEDVVVEEIVANTDFALRMQTISGCDSVVFLHVDARRVEHDTVRYIVNQHQVENEHVTVGDYTFEGIAAAGTYELRDTLTASNGCDSIVSLLLTVGENVRYSDTLCPLKDDYYFAPLDTVFAVGTVSGVYEHHGTKLVDGLPVDTIAYYDLTILPVYERFDTIEWCFYEPAETRQYEGNAHVSVMVNGTSVNGTVVTVTSSSEDVVVEEIVANTDFALRMQTTSGCDSVVFLHVDVSRVMRDTVYADVLITQVAGGQHTSACHTFTGIDGPGTYRATDTLTSSNGCDSLVTVVLIVEPLHEETLCDSTLTADLIWQSNFSDYVWNSEPLPADVGTSGYYEFPGQRIVDGVAVDTVSYLQLIVNQSYQVRDTVSFCMEEATYTAPYDDMAGVTIAVAADGTVSVTTEATSGVEVTSVPGGKTDFALRMQTVAGCDSVVFLHVDARWVERDTVRYIVNQHQVENNHVTVGDYTFEGITTAGTYELRDTLTASNGCDSIVTLLLTVGENVRYSDTLCPLKEDYYFAPLDTVFAVGTVSGVYEHHGTKQVDGLPVDTIAFYDLTILPVYERFDTIRWCLYEPLETRQYEGNAHVSVTVSGASVTVTSNSEDVVVEEIASNTDFALRMQTTSGCDSIVFLHVNAQRVEHDTVRYIVNQHQVENEHVTVSGHTFEGITAAGTYELRDTLTASNGCDSIVTLLLTVGENVRYSDTLCPLKDDYYFAPLDTVFAVGTVSGVYEHHGTKLVDGLPVDTIAYYDLTILPVYEQFDTIRWCLYEPSETRQYEGNEHVSVTVNGASVTVTSNSEDIVVEEIASNTDFALRMQTVAGCDSVVFLHVDERRVMRDTVYADVLVTQVSGGQHTAACHTFTGINEPGIYRATDTLTSSNGCDSLVTVVLVVEQLHEETICDSTLTADLTWQSNLADYKWNGEPLSTTVGTSGYYEFSGQRIVDGVTVDTVSYLQLIVHQSYQVKDTVSFCMEEATYTAPYDDMAGVTIAVAADGTVSVTAEAASGVEVIPMPGSTTDFLLRMQTISGCDSVVFLHVDARRVERDTVRYIVNQHQVENEHVTVGDYTFESITAAGTYELRDTLTASNGCDSIVTLLLTVGENVRYSDTLCPLKDDYYFAPLDTVFAVGTVSGVYEHHGTKLVDGLPVDTIAYYDLTILPVYERFDTIRWCLYEPSETRQYEGNAHVSVTVNGTSVNGTVVTVTSSSEDVVVEEIVANTDFALRMQTTSGCDSVVFLHVDVSRVMRDTVYADVLVTQVAGGQHTVACHTFTGIDAPGTYRATDTLMASNGCDSLVTVVLIVEALHEETLCDNTLTADLIWQSNLADYTWNGEPLPATVGTSGYYEFSGQRIVDGVVVDTVSYLQLIVHQSYQVKDTVSFCMEEATYTAPYDDVAGVTIAVAADGTVSVTAEAASGVEVIPMPGSTTDFLLRMQTISGCDSIVFLHVNAQRVERDTVRYIVNQHQVENEHVTVGDYTFESITAAGTYELRDTLTASNGCDSIVTLLLTVGENVRYSDTLCPLKDDYYFAPLDTVFAVGTVSGVYEHQGTKLVDGLPVDTIAYYDLTILPVYEQFDTISWCLYEPSETRQYEGNAHVSVTVSGASVTVTSNSEDVVVEEIASNTDFALQMQTVNGCDSIVFLYVNAQRVERDTVYADVLITQVAGSQHTAACHTFTGIDAPGTYRATDTLTASNGCDSLVTVVLIVEQLHEETLCDSTLTADLTWQSNLADYIWNGEPLPATVGTSGYYEFPGQRIVDGVVVDTVSYLQLIVHQSYQERDTVSFCMAEATYTTPYDDMAGVTIAVAADGTVSVTTEATSGVEVTSVPGSKTDFALRMQTTSGCDSIVFLHVNAQRVERDTVRYTIFANQVENEHITVSEHTFEGITTPGVYEIRDTLTAANGCDSVVIHELTVNPCVSDFSIVCPPDVYDTLAYGDCVMTIYPEQLGTPTLLYDGEWPFRISSEIPEDNLFAQGDNIVIWSATDLVCGYSDTCEQHVVIAFPQCPDAVDFEGNVYHGVRIGCDCWTQRNLESRRYSNGDDITGKYSYYSWQHPDTVANVETYGRLYSFEAAVRDSADNGHGHIQGICPNGWFLPTPEHYERLNEYGTPSLRSPELWIVGAGDNSTGFTALPAGYYNGAHNRFEGMLTETYFWSTKTVQESMEKCIYSVDYACDSVTKKYPMSGLGYSVRCVKEK